MEPPSEAAPLTALMAATWADEYTSGVDITVEEWKLEQTLVAKHGPGEKL